MDLKPPLVKTDFVYSRRSNKYALFSDDPLSKRLNKSSVLHFLVNNPNTLKFPKICYLILTYSLRPVSENI